MINWFAHMYPYTNFHELNLDWVIATVKAGEGEIKNFINLNTIKYADPILWNIESQYEANTVVVDGQTGNAYISVKAVPSGVHLNRTEYWTQIFNYADVVDTLRSQIATNEGNTTTSTHTYSKGDLVFVNGLLYRVIADNGIIPGDSFVLGSNITKTTVEDEIKAFYVAISTAIENEATARENADDTLQDNIDAEATARENADDTLQDNIDAEATARENADDTLNMRIDELVAGSTGYNVVNEMPIEPSDNSIYEEIKTDIDFSSIASGSISESEFSAINRILADRENNIVEIVTYNTDNENGVYHNLLNGIDKYVNTKKAMMLFGANITCLQETLNGTLFNLKNGCKSSLMKNMYTEHEALLQPMLWQDVTTFSYDDIVSTQFIPFTTHVHNEGIVKTIYNINGRNLAVYNVHIYYISGSTQDAQWSELYSIFNADTIAYRIIAGDLNVNLATYSGVDTFINGGYNVLNRGEYITYPANNIAVDGMIATPNISVLDREVLTNEYVSIINSDHLPFRARLQLS